MTNKDDERGPDLGETLGNLNSDLAELDREQKREIDLENAGLGVDVIALARGDPPEEKKSWREKSLDEPFTRGDLREMVSEIRSMVADTAASVDEYAASAERKSKKIRHPFNRNSRRK